MSKPHRRANEKKDKPQQVQTNPNGRAVVCGLIVFMLFFSFSSWRHQANFEAGFFAQRYGLHVLAPVLFVCFFSRKQAWSYFKAISVILLLTVLLLFVTGIKPFLESEEKAIKHDQTLEKFWSEVNALAIMLESDSESKEKRDKSSELEKRFAKIEKTVEEIDQLPDIYDWHRIDLDKKFKSLFLKTKQRLVMAYKKIEGTDDSVIAFKQHFDWLFDCIQHLSQ